jgi:hypothetical protein
MSDKENKANETADKAKEVATEAADKAKEVATEAADKAKKAAGAVFGALKDKMPKKKESNSSDDSTPKSNDGGHETDFNFSIPLIHTGKPGMAAIAVAGLAGFWFMIKGASPMISIIIMINLLVYGAFHAAIFHLAAKMRTNFTTFKTSLVAILIGWFLLVFLLSNAPGLFVPDLSSGADFKDIAGNIKEAALVTFFKIHIFYFLCVVGGAMVVWRIQWQKALNAAAGYGIVLLIYTVITAKMIANLLGKFV